MYVEIQGIYSTIARRKTIREIKGRRSKETVEEALLHREEGATAEATHSSEERVPTGVEGAATDNAAEAREAVITTAEVIKIPKRAKC